jgi:hypothetical protein
MTEDNQIEIPPSFIALFVPPGRSKPTASRADIAARYEFCEDLATMLTETATLKLFELSVAETDVLTRIHEGLQLASGPVNGPEARWVTTRLAELLDWPQTGWV